MNSDLQGIWVYLSASPLTGLTATLLAYQGAMWLFEKSGRNPLFNPVLVAAAAIALLLMATGIEYRVYFDGAQFVHFLLGPATVALAIPLYRQIQVLRRSWAAVGAAIVGGSLAAVASAVGLGWVLGASHDVLLSLAPKSVTLPIAMAITERLGGVPSLTTVTVMLTGITGAVGGAWVLDRIGVHDPKARGLAIGTAAHGIGTARALQMGEVTGAFAGLGMGLNGLATTILIPVLASLLR
jgi:predicted murein hydrolase (TIGR00659 family)